jgi:hypothetical protein
MQLGREWKKTMKCAWSVRSSISICIVRKMGRELTEENMACQSQQQNNCYYYYYY